MKLSKILPAVSVLSLASAAAVPAPAPVPIPAPVSVPEVKNVLERDEAKTSPVTDISKREDGANGICHVYTEGGDWDVYTWTDWYFHYDTWGTWDDDWGTGFLDNLRGKCGVEILDWTFWYDAGAPPTWGRANFRIRVNWPGWSPNLPYCTRDAVTAASWAWGPIYPPECDWPGWKWW
ncbi:hypothetical protein TWF694_004733 [Orbilia ellipsospora]|uniref:Uncharacterized protein n=1 Tax=Orbilia ellipsospora TaxID=2528407 RepID=A0AAV9WXA1_9PEZI